ncbi:MULTISPECIES: hypothetical protein [Bordetella]|uniref:Lipoprotein n=1 Tax=Bordetella petrii TaxID=94624 RepID=A0ABT7W4N5_9BORD|nr:MULTISPECIES: hypothetical protein [Bordetella]MDM9560148.1 hypothetical protein [Bordetella petrii]
MRTFVALLAVAATLAGCVVVPARPAHYHHRGDVYVRPAPPVYYYPAPYYYGY